MSFDASLLLFQLPFLTVVFFAVVLLVMAAWARPSPSGSFMPLALLGCVLALVMTLVSAKVLEPRVLYGGLLTMDKGTRFFEGTFLVATILILPFARTWLREHEHDVPEFYALVFLALSGMMLLASASDLVTLFLGIETMSLAVYVLCAFRERHPLASEAALKYYLVGAFSAAILLFGMALIYGAFGTTNLTTIATRLGRASGDPIFVLGLLCILVGLGYKVAAVPFHMWTPDAYEGAPTPVTAFMAAGVKAAAFAALLRVLTTAFPAASASGSFGWVTVIQALSILSMTLGNVAAIRQRSVKRLLAYSAIAHAGYLLVGVAAAGVVGKEAHTALLFYLVAYAVSTVGAFGIVSWLGSRGDERLAVDDLAGLAARRPALALAMTLCLLSLASVPPTGGFLAKLYVLYAAARAPELYPLVIIAVMNSVVGLFYYLRVVSVMYFRENTHAFETSPSFSVSLSLALATALVLHMGLMPGPYLLAASQ